MSNLDSIGVKEPAREYHSNPAVGSTTLKAYMKNPVEAWNRYIGVVEESKSQALIDGSLIHCLILEPHDFDNEFVVVDKLKYTDLAIEKLKSKIAGRDYAVYPPHLFTPAGKLRTAKDAKEEIAMLDASPDVCYLTPADYEKIAEYENIGDRTPISTEKLEWAKSIRDKALNYEFQVTTSEGIFRFTLLDAIKNDAAIMERSFYAFWNEDGTVTKEPNDERSYPIKARPDIMLDLGHNMFFVIDIKTAQDATPNAMIRGGSLFYHLQEAHYTKVLEAHGIKVYKFKFLFVGKEEWSGCQDYEYDQPSKELGEEHFTKAAIMHRIALDGEVRETKFEGGHYEREPVVGLPSYIFYR